MYEIIEVDKQDFCFPNPTRAVLIAPSQSGKSTAILNSIRYRDYVFTQKFTKIIYINPNLKHFLPHEEGYVQALRSAADNIDFETLSDIPSIDQVLSNVGDENSHLLTIYDDFNDEAWTSDLLGQTFVRLSSHFNISVTVL